MEVVLLAGLALAVNKTVSVIKAFANRNRNDAVTQLLVWVLGTGAVILAAHASLTEPLVVPGLTVRLGDLDGSSLVLLGWILGSSGSFAFDVKKAIDNSDSATEPSLMRQGPSTSV